jgi:hypothetical protein
MSTITWPARPFARMPSGPTTAASTSGEAGSMVITTSDACATPATPLARLAPSASSARTGSGLMS